jgi:6-phosphogluconolactonase/glucosamine-6-phosphate isomerase/deaminase
MALTVGVATVLDSREVVVVVTGQRKSLALSKAIGAQPGHAQLHSPEPHLVRQRKESITWHVFSCVVPFFLWKLIPISSGLFLHCNYIPRH